MITSTVYEFIFDDHIKKWYSKIILWLQCKPHSCLRARMASENSFLLYRQKKTIHRYAWSGIGKNVLKLPWKLRLQSTNEFVSREFFNSKLPKDIIVPEGYVEGIMNYDINHSIFCLFITSGWDLVSSSHGYYPLLWIL